MPRVTLTESEQRRVAGQARAAAAYRAEKRVQEAESAIATVGAGVPADLQATLDSLDSRIGALEAPP